MELLVDKYHWDAKEGYFGVPKVNWMALAADLLAIMPAIDYDFEVKYTLTHKGFVWSSPVHNTPLLERAKQGIALMKKYKKTMDAKQQKFKDMMEYKDAMLTEIKLAADAAVEKEKAKADAKKSKSKGGKGAKEDAEEPEEEEKEEEGGGDGGGEKKDDEDEDEENQDDEEEVDFGAEAEQLTEFLKEFTEDYTLSDFASMSKLQAKIKGDAQDRVR